VIEIVEFDPMHEDIEDHTDPDWFECPILPRADMLAVIERRRQLDGRSLNLFRNALERKPRSDLLEHYIVPNLYRPGEHYIYTTPDANQYRFRNWRPELTAVAVECQALAACALFSNPLAWIDETDLRPSERTYNAGFTVYTIESDQIPLDDQLQIIWSGKLKRIDADLRRYRDYRGYEVVYSGGKSLHFWTRDLPDLLLRPAYAANWARLAPSATMFCDIAELDPNEFQPDRALAQWEQLRRCPWALRAIHGAHWVVVADDEVFVRSWRGAKGRWYQDLAAGGPATLEFDGRSLTVQAFPAGDQDAVDRTSREFFGKYRRSTHAEEMVRPETLPTTLRLEPR
jgi:hypothetical protein